MIKTIVFRAKWLLLAILSLLLVSFHTSDKVRMGLISLLPTTESVVKSYDLPGKTAWRPRGEKRISRSSDPNARQVTVGRALHTDTHGSDEISTVIAPVFEEAWTVETDMFIAEGPVFDRQGNIYFCPLVNRDDVLLVSIEPENGDRRWAINGFSAGCGTPYVLIDPETGDDVLYLGTYDRAIAVTTDGEILWDVATGLAKLDPDLVEPEKHSFGMNYLAQYDAVVAVMGDGSVYVLDRKTGRPLLQKPFVMPGGKVPVSGFSLPAAVAKRANKDAVHMFGASRRDEDVISAVLHGAAGELQKVTNFFSIDSNSGRIWIAATLPDEADGMVDGWSDSAALYGIELVKEEGSYHFEIKSTTEVPGGTASTPTVSADGARIYIANAFDLVYAVEASTGKKIWSVNVGSKVTGSLVVAADNREVYANTKQAIVKLIDRGDHAEIAWVSRLDVFEPGLFQTNFNMLGAELGANGIAFTSSVGVLAGDMRFPYKVGAGFMDRETGEIKHYIEGGEDSVSSTVTGPDGAMYIGNSPLRRVLTRVILGFDKSPREVVGGVTKFRPIHNELIIRDALWAASTRARNSAGLDDKKVIEQDIVQIRQLLEQALRALPVALHEGAIDAGLKTSLQNIVARQRATLGSMDEQSLLALADELEAMSNRL